MRTADTDKQKGFSKQGMKANTLHKIMRPVQVGTFARAAGKAEPANCFIDLYQGP